VREGRGLEIAGLSSGKGDRCIPGDPAQREDRLFLPEQLPFLIEILGASLQFNWFGLVARRGASSGGGDVAVGQVQTIIARFAGGLIRKSRSMQRGIEEMAALITGENPTRAICAVRPGSQTDDPQSCPGIAKSRDGLPPVSPVLISLSLLFCHRRAVIPQTGTFLTVFHDIG
jgi:hypothetical protein